MTMDNRRQQGVALLMVLIALALFAGGLLWLTQQGREDIEQTRQLQARIQARAADTAARAFAMQAMRDPAWRESPLFWQALRGLPLSYRFPGGEARLLLRDMRTCFNLNALVGEEAARARRQLAYLLGGGHASMADDRLIDRLIDWIDADQQSHVQGGESDQYLRLTPPRLAANQPLRDTSELNLLLPADPLRYLLHPQLCALPDTGGWRLNANALTLQQLSLLEALYEGRLPRSLLTRLITARPAGGYRDADDLRRQLGSMDDERFRLLSEGVQLSSEHFLLGIEIRLEEASYRTLHQVEVRGVSHWHSRVAAQQVLFRSRQPAPLWLDATPAYELVP